MFGLSFAKLALLAILAAIVWFGFKLFRRKSEAAEVHRVTRAPAAATVMTTGEDLSACRVCGVFVAASSRSCGRGDCPYPR